MIYLGWFYRAFHGLLHVCGYFFLFYVLACIVAEIRDRWRYRESAIESHVAKLKARWDKDTKEIQQILPDAPADQVDELERLYRTEPR